MIIFQENDEKNTAINDPESMRKNEKIDTDSDGREQEESLEDNQEGIRLLNSVQRCIVTDL